MKIQYDGTRYEGWQKQGNTGNTIQGKIEEVLSKMAGYDVEIDGAGRTDAGVHALGQVANYHLTKNLLAETCPRTPGEMQKYLNRYLPEDIGIIHLEKTDDRFHSRLNAKEKIYRYHISTAAGHNVFERKYSYPLNEPLDATAMRKAADSLIGTWDFKSFCSNKKMKKSSVRTIDAVDIVATHAEVKITYRGNGFLYNMARILTGTLIEVGQGTREPSTMKEILESLDRQKAGATAPARGLTLVEVKY